MYSGGHKDSGGGGVKTTGSTPWTSGGTDSNRWYLYHPVFDPSGR